MKKLEPEIIEFNKQAAFVAKQENILDDIENDIIKKYCPFKKGDKVIFTEWWRGNEKDYFGIVHQIWFRGINEDAIDSRWEIQVKPTTKDFQGIKGSWNQSYKMLGRNKTDKIRLAQSPYLIDTIK